MIYDFDEVLKIETDRAAKEFLDTLEIYPRILTEEDLLSDSYGLYYEDLKTRLLGLNSWNNYGTLEEGGKR